MKEFKCNNCGANLKVQDDSKKVKCEFCNSTYEIEDLEKNGYEFEKGRIKARKEELGDLGETLNQAATVGLNGMKFIFIIPIVMFIFVAAIIGFVTFNIVKTSSTIKDDIDISEVEDILDGDDAEEKIENIKDKINKSSFNGKFELYNGTVHKLFVESIIDNAVENNDKKTGIVVKVTFNGKETENTDEMISFKRQLNNSKEYEVRLKYDDDGYVSNIVIDEIK